MKLSHRLLREIFTHILISVPNGSVVCPGSNTILEACICLLYGFRVAIEGLKKV